MKNETIKRYDHSTWYEAMMEHEKGAYVLYSDHQAVVAGLESEVKSTNAFVVKQARENESLNSLNDIYKGRLDAWVIEGQRMQSKLDAANAEIERLSYLIEYKAQRLNRPPGLIPREDVAPLVEALKCIEKFQHNGTCNLVVEGEFCDCQKSVAQNTLATFHSKHKMEG